MKNSVAEVFQIPYLYDNEPSHTMDLYRPATLSSRTHVVLYIRGGALSSSNDLSAQKICSALCTEGFFAIAVEYRRGSAETLLHQLEDIHQALRCVDEIMGKTGLLLGKVFMIGEGMGAFLATIATALQRNPSLERRLQIHPSYLEVSALVLIGGVYDVKKRSLFPSSYLTTLPENNAHTADLRTLVNLQNPLINLYLPRSFIITSKNDPFKRHSFKLADILKKSKSQHTLRVYQPRFSKENNATGDTRDHSTNEQSLKDIISFLLEHSE